jgi:RNA polymerase primary sigma factor
MLQEGALGLLAALQKFDPARGVRFATFAKPCVVEYITRGCENQARVVRLPVHVEELLGRLATTEATLTQHLQDTPTDAECADALGVSEAKVHSGRQRMVYLDAGIETHAGDTAPNELADPTVTDPQTRLERLELSSILLDAIDRSLAYRERRVIASLYGLASGEAQSEAATARAIGVSRQAVNQIHHRALGKLRQTLIAAGYTFETLIDYCHERRQTPCEQAITPTLPSTSSGRSSRTTRGRVRTLRNAA